MPHRAPRRRQREDRARRSLRILSALVAITLGIPAALVSASPAFAAGQLQAHAPGPTTGSGVALAAPEIVVEVVELPPVRLAGSYSQQLRASGGLAYTWSVTAGMLPPGIALGEGGLLSGTATGAGTFVFTATATEVDTLASASREFRIDVGVPVSLMNPLRVARAKVGVQYTGEPFTVMMSNGGPFTWDIVAGALPYGLRLDDGRLVGTPTEAGEFTYTARVTDRLGFSGTAASWLTVDPSPTLSPATLPSVTAGRAVATRFTVNGATAISFVVSAGALPPGLGLELDGTLRGVPTAVGSYSFTVTALTLDFESASRNYTLLVSRSVPTLPAGELPSGTVGEEYEADTQPVADGVAPFTFTAVGLPPGLTIDDSGRIFGRPNAAGVWSPSITATDATGGVSTVVRRLEVRAGPPVAVDFVVAISAEARPASIDIPIAPRVSGDIETVTAEVDPVAGQVEVLGVGAASVLRYTPAPGAVGPQRISYTIAGERGAASAVVTADLLPVATVQVVDAVVRAGEQVTITGTGFAAVSTVSVELHSTPIELGVAETTASGEVMARFVIPANTAPASHSIVLRGVDPAGAVVERSIPVTVLAVDDGPGPGPDGPGPDPVPGGGGSGGDAGSGGTPSPAPGDGLAATGSEPFVAALASLVMLLLGGTLRRRRPGGPLPGSAAR